MPWLLLLLAAIWVILAGTAAAHAADPAPADGPTAAGTDLADLAAWLYRAAMRGEWRLAFGALLVGVVGVTRYVAERFKSELAAAPWWTGHVLPWLPIVYAILVAVGVDLMHGKPILASAWRGVGIGATAAWAHRAIWRPLIEPVIGRVLTLRRGSP